MRRIGGAGLVWSAAAFACLVALEALPAVYVRPNAAGSLAAVTVAAAAAGAVIGGRCARRWPTSTLRLGLAAAAAGCLLLAGAWDHWLAFLGAVTAGFGAGSAQPCIVTTGTGLVDPQRRGFAVGAFGIAASGGLGLAGALGGTVSAPIAFASVALVLATTTGFAALQPGAVYVGEPRRKSQGRARAGRVLALVGGASRYGVVVTLPAVATMRWDLQPSHAAAVFTIGSVFAVVLKPVVSSATDRLPPNRVVLGTAVVLLIAAVGLAASNDVRVGMVSSVLTVAMATALVSLANRYAVGFGRAAGIDPGGIGDARGLQLLFGAVALELLSRAPELAWKASVVGLPLVLLIFFSRRPIWAEERSHAMSENHPPSPLCTRSERGPLFSRMSIDAVCPPSSSSATFVRVDEAGVPPPPRRRNEPRLRSRFVRRPQWLARGSRWTRCAGRAEEKAASATRCVRSAGARREPRLRCTGHGP